MDRSAPASMKNAANCVNQCELQDTLIIDVSNAHGGPGSLPGPRPVEGRFLPKRKFAYTYASRSVPRSFCPRPSQKQSAGPRRRRRSGSDAAGVLSHLLPLPSAGSWRSVPQWSSASRGPKECRESGPSRILLAALLLPSLLPLLDLNSDEMTP